MNNPRRVNTRLEERMYFNRNRSSNVIAEPELAHSGTRRAPKNSTEILINSTKENDAELLSIARRQAELIMDT